MCGIVGYVGQRRAQPILFDCLGKLEYRGYDSSGIAIRGSGLKVSKDKLRVGLLEENTPQFSGRMGIGHTRWATHGIPSQVNAHPHLDCAGRIAVAHNGVITNYLPLKQMLSAEGHVFKSGTDTEVIPHLIEKYSDSEGDMLAAVRKAVAQLQGSFAFVVLCETEERLLVARQDSPLVVGLGDGENLIASDVPAILAYTDRMICLDNGDVGVISSDGVRILRDGRVVERPVEVVSWERGTNSKCGCEHYMLKEIREQPRVISSTLSQGLPDQVAAMFSQGQPEVLILACGTSYHAALAGKYILEELLGMRVITELASEFNYRREVPPVDAAIVITQSGETADALACMKRLTKTGVRTLVITNVAHSSARRAASCSVCTPAGPEVSVAATKSFMAQLITFYQIAFSSPRLDSTTRSCLYHELEGLPSVVQKMLDNEDGLVECARQLSGCDDVFYIGRGVNLPIAYEGALKLKEISYIHAEGCAAGELKHGPLALMGQSTPVVALLARDRTYDVMKANIREAKTRGSTTYVITDESIDEAEGDRAIMIDRVDPLLSPVLNTVVLQLLAYHAARVRGCPIDFPRNLAKSVTVE